MQFTHAHTRLPFVCVEEGDSQRYFDREHVARLRVGRDGVDLAVVHKQDPDGGIHAFGAGLVFVVEQACAVVAGLRQGTPPLLPTLYMRTTY